MNDLAYQSIEKNPKYRTLVRRRAMLGWTLSAVMLAIYFGFILFVAFAPKVLGSPLAHGGVMTLGIPVGLLVILSAFVLVGLYVIVANSSYDALNDDIVKEARS